MFSYALLTVLLILLGMLTFVPKFQTHINRFSTGINFFLTLIATLVGVLLAMEFANIEERNKKKEHVIKLIHATISDIESSNDYSEELYEYYIGLPKKSQIQSEFFAKNPMPFPEYLKTFMAQNIVNLTLSEKTLIKLNEHKFNLNKLHTHSPKMYLMYLSYMPKILAIEIEYQKGEISLLELEQIVDTEEANFLQSLEAIEPKQSNVISI